MTPVYCLFLLDCYFVHKSGLCAYSAHRSELDHMTPNNVTVDGVQSPEAEPQGSVGCQEGWRVGEASKTSTPCTGLKTECGPVLPESSASTWALHWKTPTGRVMIPLREKEKSEKSFKLRKVGRVFLFTRRGRYDHQRSTDMLTTTNSRGLISDC